MIEIFLNGDRVAIDSAFSVTAMLAAHGFDCGRVAVAVNGEFVARADYDRQQFSVGDKVDVVAPMAGG